MAAGAELAASERRVVESHERSDAVWNRNLAARFAIQLHFDKAVRGRDATFEMHELAEMRCDFRARVARRCRPYTENPGRQIVGWRRRPCMTSAPSAGARVPVLLECGVATFDLRPPFHASRGD